MNKFIVAIVGRPNVGKSTLFNRIAKKRHAVIDDIPGITRDRLYRDAVWDDRHFIIVDTGGFQKEVEANVKSKGQPVLEHNKKFLEEVIKQVFTAVDEADIVIMMMDAENGLLPMDHELIRHLRRHEKKIFYAVNKIDGPKKESTLLNDFYSLGVDLFAVSALNGYGFENLMEQIAAMLPEGEEEKSEYPKIAIVGRPNVGKSTLVNALLSSERMIVSSIPGTTRDAVDSVCSYYKKKYVLVDTAGIRRKGKMAKTVERYSFMRTLRNIEDCDVALIVFDAEEGIVELDQRIAGLVHSAQKGVVILLNKWDLVDKSAPSLDIEKIKRMVYQKLWFMKYAPVLTISALSKKRITNLFPIVDRIIAESSRRINTQTMNEFLRKTISIKEPPVYRGRRVKIYYITQVKTNPPGFVIFTNQKEGIKEQYLKFLEGQLRLFMPFEGVPVKFYVRQRKR